MMKTKRVCLSSCLLAGLLATGCGDTNKDQPATQPSPSTTPPATESQQPTPPPPASTSTAPAAAVQQITQQASAATTALLNEAKAQLADSKLATASESLETLQNEVLTDEQKTLLSDLQTTYNSLESSLLKQIDELKSLMESEQYPQASAVLQQITSIELTVEQQQLIDDLQAKLEQALQSEAAAQGKKALGNLLGGSE